MSIDQIQNLCTTFIVTVGGGYLALVLRDAWRKYVRRKRREREGLVPGMTAYLVIDKEKKAEDGNGRDETPVTVREKVIKH